MSRRAGAAAALLGLALALALAAPPLAEPARAGAEPAALAAGDPSPAAPPARQRTFNLIGGATSARSDSLARAAQPQPWMSEDAAAESLATYWSEIDAVWDRAIPPDLLEFDISPAALDSLTRTGEQVVTDLGAGRLWRLHVEPLGRLSFNRVEGLRPGATAWLGPAGPNRPRLQAGLGYGLAAERFVWDFGADLPLLVRRLEPGRGRPPAPPWTMLGLELRGGRTVRMFAGDQRPARMATGFFYGNDPNHYFDQRGGRAELVWRPRPRLSLRLGVLAEQDRPLRPATNWNLVSAADGDPNWLIDPLQSRAMTAGVGLGGPRWRLAGGFEWHRVHDGGFLAVLPGTPGDADYQRTWATFETSRIDRHGNEAILRAQWAGTDRLAPLQWKTFLGDYGTLRGFEAQELTGDRAAWASLDVRWGFDLFRTLRIPLLGRLGLQPIAFVDWGRTWLHDGPLPDAEGLEPREGWRTDAGFGLGKLIGLPGVQGNLRFYAARPLFNGLDDYPWHFLLVLEN